MQPDSDVEIVEYRGTKVPNTANKRHGRRSKAPFIPPKEIIEVPDSSDDEQEPRAGPSAPPRLTATRSQPLFLPESDDEGEENAQPAPIARAAAPSREPTVPADPTQFYVTQVCAIIPDVDPSHVASLIPRCNGNVVEQIVNLLLESSDYPKIQNKGKGKRKRDEEDDGSSGREKLIGLAWILSKDHVTAPIIGATKFEHLTDAIAALDVILTEEEVRYLEEPYHPTAIAGHSEARVL